MNFPSQSLSLDAAVPPIPPQMPLDFFQPRTSQPNQVSQSSQSLVGPVFSRDGPSRRPRTNRLPNSKLVTPFDINNSPAYPNLQAFSSFQNLQPQPVLQAPSRPKKRHICSFCRREFIKSSHLVSHIRTHTGERPFPCEVCGKTFKMQHHLRDHEYTHMKDKPFKCSFCRKRFCQSATMMIHASKHRLGKDKGRKEADKDFELCNSASTSTSQLKSVSPPPEPSSSGQAVSPPTEPSSSGQAVSPPPEPSSSGQAVSPPPEPSSSGQAVSPPPEPSSSGQAVSPPPEPSSSGQAVSPPPEPSSSGQAVSPPPEPSSSGQAVSPPPEPSSSGQAVSSGQEGECEREHHRDGIDLIGVSQSPKKSYVSKLLLRKDSEGSYSNVSSDKVNDGASYLVPSQCVARNVIVRVEKDDLFDVSREEDHSSPVRKNSKGFSIADILSED